MQLTPAAANLLVAAADRADCSRRVAALIDFRACLAPDGKAFDKLLRALKG